MALDFLRSLGRSNSFFEIPKELCSFENKKGRGKMAILKSKKISEMTEKDVDEKKRELQLELSKEMALSEVGGSVKNPGRIKEIRRTLARILTIKSQANK